MGGLLGVLAVVAEPIVGPRIGFLDIDFFDQLLTLRPDFGGRGQLAPPSFLQQDGFHIRRVVGLVLVALAVRRPALPAGRRA